MVMVHTIHSPWPKCRIKTTATSPLNTQARITTYTLMSMPLECNRRPSDHTHPCTMTSSHNVQDSLLMVMHQLQLIIIVRTIQVLPFPPRNHPDKYANFTSVASVNLVTNVVIPTTSPGIHQSICLRRSWPCTISIKRQKKPNWLTHNINIHGVPQDQCSQRVCISSANHLLLHLHHLPQVVDLILSALEGIEAAAQLLCGVLCCLLWHQWIATIGLCREAPALR